MQCKILSSKEVKILYFHSLIPIKSEIWNFDLAHSEADEEEMDRESVVLIKIKKECVTKPLGVRDFL